MSRLRMALGLLLAGVLAGCGGGGPVTGDDWVHDADNVIFGFRMNVTTDGIRRAVIEADTAYYYEGASTAELRRVQATLYDEEGRQAGTLTSDAGRADLRTDEMTARGNVVLISLVADQRVETPELHFDPRRDRIWSDEPTTLYEDGTTIHGSGFSADSRLQDLHVRDPHGRVEGVKVDF